MTQVFRTIHDRYLTRRLAGSGHFGTVWKADDTHLNRTVAIKEIPLRPETGLSLLDDPVYEARMLASLEHPHVPAVHDVFFEQGNFYIVMQWIEGKRLDLYRREKGGPRKAFPLDLFFHVSLQLCQVMRFLHEREHPIVFRDLKPRNVLLTRGPRPKLYLVDFGGATVRAPGVPSDDEECFSLGYVAPEVERGVASSSPITDIYSLSVTLYEWLTNRSMVWFDGEAHIDLPGLPDLEDLLRRGTARIPQVRPQSVKEMEHWLKRAQKRVRASQDLFVEREQGAPLIYSAESCPLSA